MSDINKLQQEEIQQLTNEDLEVFELEQLITNGVEEKIPIEIKYKNQTFGALIRPLNSIEWNNAVSRANNRKDTNMEAELLKIGLYNKDGTPFNPELIPKLPAGISSTIMKEIAKVSGVNFNSEENVQLVRKIMGF